MKVFKYIVTTLLWTILALYLITAVTLRIPSVQAFIGAKVADAASEKLNTRVSIGQINIGMLNRIVIDDIAIDDQQQKEMLRAARLTAKIDLLALATGRISISTIQLFSAHAWLYRRDSLSAPNCQFVIDALSSKDTTSSTPLDLRINSVIIRRSSVSYDQLDASPTPGQFNPSHLRLSDISAQVALKSLTNDSVNVNVKRLSFNEQSGIYVTSLSFRFNADKKAAQLTNLTLTMPDSRVMGEISLSFSPTHQGEGNNYLRGGANASLSGHITPSDLRAFIQPLKNYQKPIRFSTRIHGTDKSIDIEQLDISSETNDIDLSGRGWVAGLKISSTQGEDTAAAPSWQATIDRLALSDSFIDFLTKTFRQIPSAVRRIGNLQAKGIVSRASDGTLTSNLNMVSSAGQIALTMRYDTQRRFKGSIKTADTNLGQLLDNQQFGILATDVNVEGQLFDNRKPTVKAEGKVSQFDYNGYTYSDITLNGTFAHDGITGQMSIDDPNISLQLEGTVQEAEYELKGSINTLAPQALHLTDQWGNARFSADIECSLSDTGSLTITNFNKDDYHLHELHVESHKEDNQYLLTLNSDFAQAEITWEAPPLPTKKASNILSLPGIAFPLEAVEGAEGRLTVTKTDWLQEFFGIPLELYQPLTLNATADGRQRRIDLKGTLPSFSYNGGDYRHANLILDASATNDSISTSLQWDNHGHGTPTSGMLNATTLLGRDDNGHTTIHVNIRPSTLTMGPSTWQIDPSDIAYTENRLDVRQFTIHHDDQYIHINGNASKQPTDTLTVELNRVEVDYILELVNFTAVDFGGYATGHAVVTAPFSNSPNANAHLRVDNFTFENGDMGTLHANAAWNNNDKQIDINGYTETTFINGYVAPSASAAHPIPFIDLDIKAQGTPIDFLYTYTDAFLSDISGQAYGSVRVGGPLSNINLTGKLTADGQATVIPTGCTYRLKQAPVTFVPNDILLDSIPVTDKHGTVGYLSGGIHHEELTNLTFDLTVDANNLLAYDKPEFGDQSFCGTVYATGRATLEGRKGRVTIDLDITPQANTVFQYNAAQTDTPSSHEYITWGSYGGEATGNDESTWTHDSQSPQSSQEAQWFQSPQPGTSIYLNFAINATPDATVRLLMDQRTGDYITLNGSGALRAAYYNKGNFTMFGTYTVDHGTYNITIQNIIQKHFTFQPGGTIIFGGDPYDAALNLQAMHTVQGVSLADLSIGDTFSSNTIRVNCLMNIGGQPKAPQVTFDLEMPTVNADEQQMIRSLINGEQAMNQQALYLLGIGRFYNNGQNNAASNQQDATSLAMQSLLSGTLSAQLNNLLSQVINNNTWHIGANISTGTEGWNNAEYEGIVNGSMLNNRLLINGQFGYRDKATQATPTFIGDFDIRYLLLPNGNLALKVYNQTNDRYFTRSSLNTQGIGLVIKKDFNGLRQLWQRKKKK